MFQLFGGFLFAFALIGFGLRDGYDFNVVCGVLLLIFSIYRWYRIKQMIAREEAERSSEPKG